MNRTKDFEDFQLQEIDAVAVNTSKPVTFASEKKGSAEEGVAEMEVIKSILNRENYLERIRKTFKGMGRTLKLELADAIDYYRIASIDVVEAIEKWREIRSITRGIDNSVFLWNDHNYLLKMVKDLDFLDSNRSMRKWAGFRLESNPFCIPTPLDQGKNYFEGASVDPQHLDGGAVEGFTFAGGAVKTAKASEINEFMEKAQSRSKKSSPNKMNSSGKGSPLKSPYAASMQIPKSMKEEMDRAGIAPPPREGALTSFVPNEDMKRIRLCERLIIAELDTFGLDVEYEIGVKAIAAADKAGRPPPKQAIKAIEKTVQNVDVHFVSAPTDAIPPQHPSKEPILGSPEAKILLVKEELPQQPRKRGTKPPRPQVKHPVKRNTIADRLAEIEKLRAKVKRDRLALEQEKIELSGRGKMGRMKTGTAMSKSTSVLGRPEDPVLKRLPGGPNDEFGSDNDDDSETETEDESENEAPSGHDVEYEEEPEEEAGETDDNGNIESDASGELQLGGQLDSSIVGHMSVDIGFQSSQSPNYKRRGMVNLTNTQPSAGEISLDPTKLAEQRKNRKASALVKSSEFHQEGGDISMDGRPITAPQEGDPDGDLVPRDFFLEEAMKSPPGTAGSHLPKETENLPDEEKYELMKWSFCASLIQRCLRGWFARRWVNWHRGMVIDASIVIQSLIRGFIGRRRAYIKLVYYQATTIIQSLYRGGKAREYVRRLRRNMFLGDEAIKIQAQWRRIRGRKRVQSKFVMEERILEGIDHVNQRSLFVSDVEELSRRLAYATSGGKATLDINALPPDESLHLLRLVAMLLYESRSPAAGKATYQELGLNSPPHSLTWKSVLTMLKRGETFLRMIRALAKCPQSHPPTVYYISEEVTKLVNALQFCPRWCLATFQQMGKGAKLCEQLFKFVNCLLDVAKRQEEFMSYLTESFPEWLPTLLERQAKSREMEFTSVKSQRCVERMKEILRTLDDDPLLYDNVSSLLNDMEIKAKAEAETYMHLCQAEDSLKGDEEVRELKAIEDMERHISIPDNELTRITMAYKDALYRAERGDDLAHASLHGLRVEMLDLQRKLGIMNKELSHLKEQYERGKRRRKNKGRLPGQIRVKALAIGDYQAVYTISKVIMDTFVTVNNADTDESNLSSTQKEAYQRIRFDYESKKNFLNDAEAEVAEQISLHDESVMQEVLKNADSRDKFSRDLIASDYEKQNNEYVKRAEDLKASGKRNTFVPDEILDDFGERPRPVIIMLTRDIPARSKGCIHRELTRFMPGGFITLDQKENYGVNGYAIQTVLDGGRNVLMNIDHGLTKFSREQFVRKMEAAVKQLVPQPFLVMIMGDDWNRLPLITERTTGTQSSHLGVHRTDLVASCDGEIKACMQNLSKLLADMVQAETIDKMRIIEETMREPSAAYLMVMEALFVLQGEDSGGDEKGTQDFGNAEGAATTGDAAKHQIRRPDNQLAGVSWRSTQGMFRDPTILANKLKIVKRGQSSKRLRDALRLYISHKNWPPPIDEDQRFILRKVFKQHEIEDGKVASPDDPDPTSTEELYEGGAAQRLTQDNNEREHDGILNMLASYVEAFLICEELTQNGGGAASNALVKKALKSLQTVLTVRDPDAAALAAADRIGRSGKRELGAATKMESIRNQAWQEPAALAVRAALLDMRVLKRVQKIDKVMMNINVYRESEYIYFDVYDSATSKIEKTVITRDEISDLLLPDRFSLAKNTPITPPTNPSDMYQRLVNLLRFSKESHVPGANKVLVCRRDLTFISKASVKISGHVMFLSTYEESLGEIYLYGYIPSSGATVTLHIDDKIIDRLALNAHPTLEDVITTLPESTVLWPYAKERLKVDPPRSNMAALGDGLDAGFELSYTRHAAAKNVNKSSDNIDSNGLTLKLRVKGGVGRKVTQCLVHYGNVPHILSVWLHGVTDALRVIVYEPIDCMKSEIILTNQQRRVLLGTVTDDFISWMPALKRRLHLDWRAGHKIQLESSVYKRVRPVVGRRLVVSVLLCDHNQPHIYARVMRQHERWEKDHPHLAYSYHAEQYGGAAHGHGVELHHHHHGVKPVPIGDNEPMLIVRFFDPIISTNFDALLTKEDMIRVLHYEPPYSEDIEVNTTGLAEALHKPKEDMLRRLVIESANSEFRELDSSAFDISVTDLLSEQSRIVQLVDRLVSLVVRIDYKDFKQGYKMVVPVEMEMLPHTVAPEGPKRQLNLRLRQQHILDQRIVGTEPEAQPSITLPLAGSGNQDVSEGEEEANSREIPEEPYIWPLLRSRQQSKPLKMEVELNRMVKEHARIAREKRMASVGASALLALGEGFTDTRAINATSTQELAGTMKANTALTDDTVAEDENTNANTTGDENIDNDTTASEEIGDVIVPSKQERKRVMFFAVDEKLPSVKIYDSSGAFEEGQLEPYGVKTLSIPFDIIQQRYQGQGPEGEPKPKESFAGAGAVPWSLCSAIQKKALKVRQEDYAAGRDLQDADFTQATVTVYQEGVKTHFREAVGYTTVRWFGHVAITVTESLCYDEEEGVGRRLLFQCFESHTSSFYYGLIRSTRHLREVLGVGTDHDYLLDKKNSYALVDFICRNKLEMVLNTTSWDGVAVEKGSEPDYRVEFRSDRIFDFEKITPLNVGSDKDQDAQDDKLIHMKHKRGMKILRMVRKVSGLILQMTIFEIPDESGIRAGDTYEVLVKGEKPNTDSPDKSNTSSGGSPLSPNANPKSPPTSPTKPKPKKLVKRTAPAIRLIAYDAVSRGKSTLELPPEAVSEIAGGSYSPFLELLRRKELAKIIGNAALLTFPKGKGFEVFVNWSGALQKAAGVAGDKKSWRSSAERVIKRPGKIFRSGVKITGVEMVLTVYTQPKPSGSKYNVEEKQVVFNFYANDASEAFEFIILDEEQQERVGRKLLDFPQGAARASAIRRLCKCCRADIMEDPKQDDKLVLTVELLPLDSTHGLAADEEHAIAASGTGTGGVERVITQNEKEANSVRYFGIGGNGETFEPKEAKGSLIMRTDHVITYRGEPSEYIVSAYTRGSDVSLEQGLILRIFSKSQSDTLVMHIYSDTLVEFCTIAGEPDLVRDSTVAFQDLSNNDPEDVRLSDLGLGLERTDRPELLKALQERVVAVILNYCRIRESQGLAVPYLEEDKTF